ncbi:MAG: murein transglycosylase A [Kofleriaceae bacterium]
MRVHTTCTALLVAACGSSSVAPRAAQSPPAARCPDAVAEPPPPSHDQLTLTRVTFADLPGWAADRHAEAIPSFLRSCAKLAALADHEPVGHDGHGGLAKQWRRACAAAANVPAGDHAAARAMFEAEFVPHAAAGKTGPQGKLTGYYVAAIRASRTRTGKYQIPVLGRPRDLVMIDLSRHINDAHGRRIWGRHDERGNIVPYPTRYEIRTGRTAERPPVLMYADDPVDLLFAQIQGSAKAQLADGTTVWLGFAGKNGRTYRGVGRVLRRMGELKPPFNGTMQGIRAWFAANPTRFDEIADQNEAYVFFAESKQPGAIGSQGVVLTAERSMAVDRAFVAASTPIWVQTRAPVVGRATTAPWTKLLIAQDTGAGIQGAVRGDIYWGDDDAAGERGGRMGGPGKYWLLLPRGVTR